MGNSIGRKLLVTSFGESHGRCIGVVVDGYPAGYKIDLDMLQAELNRRRPGQSIITTSRKEQDRLEVLSGLLEGVTTGAPICMLVWNKDIDSSKYEDLRWTPRPGHADYTAEIRYGGYQDYRGGGRFSGRNTAGIVIAGALAKQLLKERDIEIIAYTDRIGEIETPEVPLDNIRKVSESNIVRCPHSETAEKMINLIKRTGDQGDSIGGQVKCIALNFPPGIGNPLFDTIEGDLAKIFYSIPAVKAVEFGAGVRLGEMKGSESNDEFIIVDGEISTITNNSGGVQGGISNGMPITCTITFKATPSIRIPQKTVHIKERKHISLEVKGRHDPCIVPRAIPVVESAMAIVLTDFLLNAGWIKQFKERKT
jgi:chorismate synthase